MPEEAQPEQLLPLTVHKCASCSKMPYAPLPEQSFPMAETPLE
jgi:hypothetical protein